MKILIVDDHETNLRLLRAQLEAEAYHVLSAGDGVEAMALLEREPVDAVMSDVFMPRMDGYRLCRLVRRHPRLKDLPFIFYSATCTSPTDRKLGASVGADRFICKPSPFQELRNALHELLTTPRPRQPAPGPGTDDLDLLQHYSEGLVAKLEEKSDVMRQVITERDAEIGRRIEAELALRDLNIQLENRVRERTAELVTRNKELEESTYSISHDLRSPLRAMTGFGEALKEECGQTLSREAKAHLDEIIQAGRHMGELVDGLLTLARCTQGELGQGRVDLTAFGQRLSQEYRATDPDRVVDWRIQAGMSARGDTRMIEVVLRNLLGNAWKYTARHPTAKIEFGQVAPIAETGSQAEGMETTAAGPRPAPPPSSWFVRDNGAGFDMRHADQLFKPFQRLHRQDEFPGIGIGLATARRIVQRHGGTIHAAAAVGQGATFTFSLPETVKVRNEPS